MKHKQWLFYDKAGDRTPAFYNAFSCIDGPIVYMFVQAHLDLMRRLIAYLRGRD